jgi:hypothetical protein
MRLMTWRALSISRVTGCQLAHERGMKNAIEKMRIKHGEHIRQCLPAAVTAVMVRHAGGGLGLVVFGGVAAGASGRGRGRGRGRRGFRHPGFPRRRHPPFGLGFGWLGAAEATPRAHLSAAC